MSEPRRITGGTITGSIRMITILFLILLIPLTGNTADVNDELLIAAFKGRTETVKALLAKGGYANAKDDGDMSALMGAARNGHHETVKVLIAHGADVNATLPGMGDTALILAARHGHLEVVKLLLAHGADVNAAERVHGDTALLAAARRGRSVVVKLLLAHDADVNAKDKYGQTALALAQYGDHSHTVLILNEAGLKNSELYEREGPEVLDQKTTATESNGSIFY